MASTNKSSAIRRIKRAWLDILAELRHLDSNVIVKPKGADDIFRIDDSVTDGIHFDIEPIVISTSEKAASNKQSRLYVVIKGSIVFELAASDDNLETRSFATNIGYFRESGGEFKHVYGAHFDFDPKLIAHPVFHVQMSTHATLFSEIRKRYHSVFELKRENDLMHQILKNVRVPTAQMDFFAVFLQVCSDHLINEKSEKSKRSQYANLRQHCSFFRSYGAGHTGLRASIESACHRSPYWYDHSPSPAPDDAN